MCQLSEIRKDIQITKLLRKYSNYGHLLLNIYKISLYTSIQFFGKKELDWLYY